MDGLTHIRVEVHRINKINIWILLAKVFHCGDHANETVTKVFSSVAGYEHKLFASVKAGYVVSCILKHIDLLIGKGLITL